MTQYAQITDNKVVGIVTLTDDEYAKIAPKYQNVIDITDTPAVAVGWILSGNKLTVPPDYDIAAVIQANVLEPAVAFCERIAKRFTAENIVMGITQAGKTELIGETLRDLSYWTSTGSLYCALGEIQKLKTTFTPEMSPFITLARLVSFENQIRQYLGLPTV